MKTILLAVVATISVIALVPPNANASHGSSAIACEADGYEAGQDGPFSQDLYNTCQGIGAGDEYYDGFIAGCIDANNTRTVCEQATDAE